jgi:hypothetical protein
MIISASYCNSDNTAVVVQTAGRGSVAIQLIGDDNSGGLREEYLVWSQSNETVPYASPAVNALAAAEAWVASYFSTPRLLQMKDWRDTFPEEDAPMLEAVYDWVNGITIQAAQGQTNFAAPPHTFEELVAEAMFILGVEQP